MLFWRLTLKDLFSGNLTYELFSYLASLFVLCQWLDQPAVLRDVNIFQTKALLWFQHAKYRSSLQNLDVTRETGITNSSNENLLLEIVCNYECLEVIARYSCTCFGHVSLIQVFLSVYLSIFAVQKMLHTALIFLFNSLNPFSDGLICETYVLKWTLNTIKFHWHQCDWDGADALCSSGWYVVWGLHRTGVHLLNLLNKQRGEYSSTLPPLNTRLG